MAAPYRVRPSDRSKKHPTGCLLAASGTAASILAEDNSVDGLIRPDRLHEVEQAVRDQAARMGVSLPPDYPVEVHRAELATDLRFSSALGLDVLRGFAGLPVPWHVPEIYAAKGSPSVVTGVQWRRAERVQMHVYDRGRKRRTAAPGTSIRLERQYRRRARSS
jgi:hypothetical protein